MLLVRMAMMKMLMKMSSEAMCCVECD